MYFAGFFDIFRSNSGKIVVCAGVLGSNKGNKAFVLQPGQQKVCLQGPLDIPSAGSWKNCGMCWCFVGGIRKVACGMYARQKNTIHWRWLGQWRE